MMKGVTRSGFRYSVSDRLTDDYEILELIADVEGKNEVSAIPKLLEKVLGEKQKQALLNFVKKRHGYVSMKALTEELTEILQGDGLKK